MVKKILIPVFVFVATLLAGCATRGDQEDLQARVFEMQTRLLTLENRQKGGVAAQESHGKTLATSHARLDKIERELQKIVGQLEVLEMGIRTGEMPGTEAGVDTVARSLVEIASRLETVETNQNSLLEAVDKATKKKGKASRKKSKSRAKLSTVAQMDKSFSKKHYKTVAASGPKLIKSLKGKGKERALYLYAESLYKLGRLRDAALQYNDYVEKGYTEYIAHAKMRMGDCFRHLGDQDAAKLYYEELIDQFPSTSEATKAKERLTKM